MTGGARARRERYGGALGSPPANPGERDWLSAVLWASGPAPTDDPKRDAQQV